MDTFSPLDEDEVSMLHKQSRSTTYTLDPVYLAYKLTCHHTCSQCFLLFVKLSYYIQTDSGYPFKTISLNPSDVEKYRPAVSLLFFGQILEKVVF